MSRSSNSRFPVFGNTYECNISNKEFKFVIHKIIGQIITATNTKTTYKGFFSERYVCYLGTRHQVSIRKVFEETAASIRSPCVRVGNKFRRGQ